MKSNIEYILYARRSSDREDYQAPSIEQQVDELRTLAAKRDLDIAEEIIESASAKELGRPMFRQLISHLSKGKDQRYPGMEARSSGAKYG
jgi:DNA invertase Pin-like site-specific DNA recombinase